MTCRQKYYVLENGEYVLKYRDSKAQTLKNKLSPEKTYNPEVER